jgi:two-component system, sporulation sensor kinase D
MKWTDQIRQVKIFLVVAAVFIAVASLVVSHFMTRDLEKEERNKMEVWAEAMRTLNKADENTDLNLVLKVINENNTIPVIVMDSQGRVQTFRNLNVSGRNYNDSLKNAAMVGNRLKDAGQTIKISLDDSVRNDYIDVCYDDSLMLKRLETYPFVQLGVVLIFVVIAIFALLTSKRAEQNKVWVGLSKETAHQLGTPISSLMAWIEILKENYPDDTLIPEMDKDVKRLQLIADRFSKIGSLPEPVPSSLNEVIDHVIDYMDRRTSKKVRMIKQLPSN